MKSNRHFFKLLLSVAFLFLLMSASKTFSQELALGNTASPSAEVEVVEEEESEEKKVAIQHEQHNVVGTEGQIYWNKNLPVYISLLTSPDSKDGMIIKTDPEGKVEPYYFDTEGLNWIRTRWQVDPETREMILPKQEVMWPVIVDGKAPTTSATFSASGKFSRQGVTYYSGDLQVELSAKDATSGVESIFYSLGNDFQTYSNAFAIDGEKSWELKYYAVDKVGNYSQPQESDNSLVNFEIDKTAPTTELTTEGPRTLNILSSKSSLLLTSSDSKSGVKRIRYTLAKQATKTYTQPIGLSSLSDGFHQLEYNATDNVTNQEEPNVFVFYLDRIAPEISVEVEGDMFESENGTTFVSERAKLKLNSSDNQAGVDLVNYKVDSEEYQVFRTPVGTNLKQGVHSISYYGNDKVENTSKTATFRYTVDTDAPKISYKVDGPSYVRHDTLFVRSTSKFNVTSVDNGSYQSGVKTTQYSFGSKTDVAYAGAFSIETDGLTSLTLNSSDNVNNESELNQVVFVDNQAPAINHTFSVDKIGQKVVRENQYTIYPYDVQLYLAAMDEHVGSKNIYYQIGDGIEKKYVAPISGFKAGANVELKVRSVDLLGNESSTVIVFATE